MEIDEIRSKYFTIHPKQGLISVQEPLNDLGVSLQLHGSIKLRLHYFNTFYSNWLFFHCTKFQI